jgi:predicted nucleic acid-binding protein
VRSPVVIDASLAIKWVIEEEGTKTALALRDKWKEEDAYLCAPDFMLVELHSIIWKKLLRGLVQPTDPIIGQTPTFGLDLNWTSTQFLLTSAFLLAIQHRVSIYDALYAALAQSLQAPLYTADQSLVEKLKNSTVAVQTFG